MSRSRLSPAALAVLGAALLFFLFLGYATPYSPVDDLQWGMEEGLRWWLGGLLNGRYAGNFFAVVMCRSPVVKTLLMGLGMFALPLLMALVAGRGARSALLPGFCFCCAGLLLMPSQTWKETFCWVCGFGNYVVSILFFLVWLLLILRAENAQTHLARWSAALFLLDPAARNGLLVLPLCAFWGIAVTAFNVTMQGETIHVAPGKAAPVATAIYSGIYNLGISAGSWIGGLVAANGAIHMIGYAGGLLGVLAVLFCFLVFTRLLKALF